MQALMLRLDGLVRRRRGVVLALWVALLAAAVPLAVQQSDRLSGGGFEVPGSQSDRVEQRLGRDFDRVQRSQLGAVLIARGDGAARADLRAALARLRRAAGARRGVALAPPARERAERAIAVGERTLVVPLASSVAEDDAIDVAVDLREDLHVADGPREGVATHLIGQGALWAGMQEVTKQDLETAETTGFPIVLAILLAVFGSLVAAALPLALGLVSVLVCGALIFLLSQAMDMSVFVTNMASMIGIGVAVDYSLFVLARYRQEVANGYAPPLARARAMATSGIAVLFSGLTVIVSLAGLWMVDNTAIRSMALGAILVVAVALAASATLLPALISLAGHRAIVRSRLFRALAQAVRSRRRRRGSTTPGVERRTAWDRWTAFVTARPLRVALLAGTALVALAIPLTDMRTDAEALRQLPRDFETRQGFEAAARIAPPGESAPARVLVELRAGVNGQRTVGALRARIGRDPEVARVGAAIPSRDGRAVLIDAVPRHDGESAATKAMVERLRDALPALARDDARVSIGGSAAAERDISNLIASSMWLILVFVLGLSFVVLLVLLRSVVLPLKAVLMNLLSVGAAYGVLVAVFQWGWVDWLVGDVSTGSLDTLTPPLVLAVVFGLSMDYEVFLLSRIRERYEATGDTSRAIAQGLARSGPAISSAALIMVAVFAVFVGTGVPSIQQLGLGCAVAIALDATLVRLALVPAAMKLLDDWNWYLPGRLERILPRSSFERLPAPRPGAPAPAGT